MSYLTQDQITHFHEQGYLVLESLISQDKLDQVKERAVQLVNEWDDSDYTVFTTVGQRSRVRPDYFQESAEKISCFMEDNEEAIKRFQQDRMLAINKIGHALHDLDPVFQEFSYNPTFYQILRDLGHQKPTIVQSMYILKPPQIGGEVGPHQDGTFIMSDPPTCIGVWVALEDANLQNSCLFAKPGSHKNGSQNYFVRKNGGLEFTNEAQYDTEGGQCLEVPAGSVVLIHHSLVHWSGPNVSDRSRHAYSLHVVDGEAKWCEENWLQRPNLPFREWLGVS